MASADNLVQATLLGDVVDNLSVAVFVTDDMLRYVAVNRAACELLGYSRAELLELSVADVVDRPAEQLRSQARDAERAGAQAGTITLRRRDGEHVEVWFHTVSARIAQHLPVLVSFVLPPTDAPTTAS